MSTWYKVTLSRRKKPFPITRLEAISTTEKTVIYVGNRYGRAGQKTRVSKRTLYHEVFSTQAEAKAFIRGRLMAEIRDHKERLLELGARLLEVV